MPDNYYNNRRDELTEDLMTDYIRITNFVKRHKGNEEAARTIGAILSALANIAKRQVAELADKKEEKSDAN